MGMRVGNHHQLSSVNLAPTAHITVSKFGEIRGGEAFDLLQLLNTGHSGTLSTIHANSAKQGLARFTSCVLQSGVELPYRAIKTNIADSLNFVVHVERRPGRRYISEVLEINGYDPDADMFDYGAVFLAKQAPP
jgi:pilus assembly protein CpaF